MTRPPPPILVTGTHRSGSTWVGQMLAVSPAAHYVHEPFAPMYERSWLRHPPEARFHHETPHRPGPHFEDLQRIRALRPPWSAMARRTRSLRHIVRIVQEAADTRRARLAGARAIIKDPFALLSAEWIARYAHGPIIVLVRHPAAFASSVTRLGWRLDVRWLLGQPELIDGDLAPFRQELEHDGDLDLLDHAVLIWRALNTVVQRYERDHPSWNILRYEDLATDPVSGFQDLYTAVGLPWEPKVAAQIAERTSVAQPGEVASSSRGGTDRNSRQAMWTWTRRLTEEQIARVRTATRDVAEHWYDDTAWTPPRL